MRTTPTPTTDGLEFHAQAGMMPPYNTVPAVFARRLECAVREAYTLIDVLYMDALDHNKESWPRAREWQERWARFKPNTATMAGDEIALPSVPGSAPRISE